MFYLFDTPVSAWNNDHYTAIFPEIKQWLLYDGLKNPVINKIRNSVNYRPVHALFGKEVYLVLCAFYVLFILN